MPRRLRQELTYDAPAARVHAMLTDPGFREEVCRRLKVVRATATVEPAGDGRCVTIDQTQRTTGVPSFAHKILGEEIQIVQRETWTSPAHADVHVTIPGRPGEMHGTATLSESGGTTTEVVDLEISVRLPLVGGRLETFVADMLSRALEVENAAGRDYLSR